MSDNNSDKYKKEKKFIKKPEYPGGANAFREFIKGNLVYPKEALKKRIEGYVLVKASVDTNGNVIDTKIEKGLGHGCDEEALRLVKMIKYGAVKNKGLKVTTTKKIRIVFKLPQRKNVIQYELKKTTNIKPPGTESGKTYGYSINLSEE